jgi:hypothetical protein
MLVWFSDAMEMRETEGCLVMVVWFFEALPCYIRVRNRDGCPPLFLVAQELRARNQNG